MININILLILLVLPAIIYYVEFTVVSIIDIDQSVKNGDYWMFFIISLIPFINILFLVIIIAIFISYKNKVKNEPREFNSEYLGKDKRR